VATREGLITPLEKHVADLPVATFGESAKPFLQKEKKMSQGWIKLHRQLQDFPQWTSEKFTRSHAWVDLLLLANHSYSFYYIRGNKVEVFRGEIARSEDWFAERWKWSRGKLGRYLKTLQTEQQIEIIKTGIINKIKILNYDFYQEKDDRQYSRQTTERRQKDIYNNDKNINNVNNDIDIKKGNKSYPQDCTQSYPQNEKINKIFLEKYDYDIMEHILYDGKAARTLAKNFPKKLDTEENFLKFAAYYNNFMKDKKLPDNPIGSFTDWLKTVNLKWLEDINSK
jgi:hypothetical protein